MAGERAAQLFLEALNEGNRPQRPPRAFTACDRLHLGFGQRFGEDVAPIVDEIEDRLHVDQTVAFALQMRRGARPTPFARTVDETRPHRRLFDSRIRTTSSFGDIAILLLLFAQLLLGLATIPVSMGHLDGHEMVRFMTWAQGILLLRGDVWMLVADTHPIFKVHLFLGMTIFLVFPFTRLVHVWSAPIWYLGRRGYQVVRSSGRPHGAHPAPRPVQPAE